MATVARNTRQPRRLTVHWMASLALIVGLVVTALILTLVLNENSPPAHSGQSQAPASAILTPEPPAEQAPQAGRSGSSEVTGSETEIPENTPTPTSTSSPDVESTPETGSVAPSESPDATATPGPTVVPEPESSTAFVDNSADSNEDRSSSNAAQDSSDPVPAAPTPGVGSPPGSITRIQIPAIGVNAPIEVRSIDSNGVMENPSSVHAVAWYDFTSRPEDRGNAVFAGHLDYAGVGPAVFWELGSLSPGDEVNVTLGNGSVVKYRITGVRSVHMDSDASDIVAKGNAAKITIITCGGSFDPASQNYNRRTIVTGERVG